MITMSTTLRALTCALFIMALSCVAQAQATRTWVSGVGDDLNPCSRTAPCKTYAGAISKTAVNGEISTLDPGGFGAVTITKSITIEGTQGQGYGSILHTGTTGVSINFDNFNAAGEGNKTVRLRNLNINGSGGLSCNAGSGLRGIRITGGAAAVNTEVFVEDCVIDGSQQSPGQGIIDDRDGGGLLSVTNTTIRNMLGAGLGTAPANNAPVLKVVVTGSRFINCGSGIAVSTNTKVAISNSVFTNNTTGIFGEDLDASAAASNTELEVDNCVVSSNTTGFNAGVNSTIRVSNTTALNNTTLASGAGLIRSYSNNRTGGTAFPGTIGPN